MEFEKQVADYRLKTVGLTAYEVLTLASVVEKEERVDRQRKDVAGVLLNRIDV